MKMNNENNKCIFQLSYFLPLVNSFLLAYFPPATESFTPYFVWSAINKTLEEDRLVIVDANNEKVKIKSCTQLVLYNEGSAEYVAEGNYTRGNAILVDVSSEHFATPKVVQQVKEQMEGINPGTCVPCIVVVSIVNVTYAEDTLYTKVGFDQLITSDTQEQLRMYKLNISLQLTELLQFKTPIQARHLVLVRLTERKEDLTKCHGKRYTKYPTRLVPIWEQVLFDHFKEARVIQGTTEKGVSETTLNTGKECGVFVWMCEEIVRRLEMQEKCSKEKEKMGMTTKGDKGVCERMEKSGNMSTAAVDMEDPKQCGVYRART